MADTGTVKMRLTFWRDGKKPGDIIDIPADEVHRWKGYAQPVTKTSVKTPVATAADTQKATK